MYKEAFAFIYKWGKSTILCCNNIQVCELKLSDLEQYTFLKKNCSGEK